MLVAVAVLGVYRHVELNQSSWQGASFGMFATYDNISSRAVAVSASDGEDEAPLALPDALADDVTRLKVVASDRNAARLARDALASAPPEITTVTVEVRRIVVSIDDGLTIHVEPLARGSAAR